MTKSKNSKVLINEDLPNALRRCSTWLNWMTFDKRHGKKVAPYKSPITPNGHHPASYNEPSNWVSLEDAITRANAEDDVHVGVSLTDQGVKIGDSYLWCLDFDGFSATEGDDDGAVEFAREVRTYTEFSISNTGFKMYFLSDTLPVNTPKIHFTPSKYAVLYPDVKKYQERAIEVFSRGRFLAITGANYFKDKFDLKFIPNAELHELLRELDQWAKSEGGVGVSAVSPFTGGNHASANGATNATDQTEYGKLTESCLITVLAQIDHHDEQVWSGVCNALARAYGESGCDYFLHWSKDGYRQDEYHGFDAVDAKIRYNRALNDATVRAGYGCKHLCHLAGVDPTLEEWQEPEFTPQQRAALDALLGDMGHSTDPKQPTLPLDKPSHIIDLFNKDHFVAMENSSTWVFKEAFDPELGVNKLDRFRPISFKDLHNQSIIVDGKSRRIGEYWFNHQERRAYQNGFVFMPSGDCPNGVYNLWRGFGVQAVQGDVKPILEYIKEVLCKGDALNYDYLINWLAYGVQNADRQGEVAVVMRGLKGTGKSTLGKLMCKVYGRHGMQITNSKHLIGNFNAHLREKVFLFADEAFFAGNRQDEDVLKGLVTEQYVTIEKKGVDAVTARNRLQILMSSNHDWVVPASSDERRYFILDVSEERIGDTHYWQKLNKCINSGGAEAFLYYLQSLQLANFDVRTSPNTTGLDAQKLQGLGSIESVVNRWLSFGKVCGYKWASHEGLKVLTNGVFNEVKDFCKESPRHRYDTPADTTIGRKLKQLVGANKKRERVGKELENVYTLPSLEDARAIFTAHLKLTNNPWLDENLAEENE